MNTAIWRKTESVVLIAARLIQPASVFLLLVDGVTHQCHLCDLTVEVKYQCEVGERDRPVDDEVMLQPEHMGSIAGGRRSPTRSSGRAEPLRAMRAANRDGLPIAAQ